MPRLLLLVPTTSYRISDFLGAARRLDVEVTVGSNRRQVLEKFSPGRTVTLDFRASFRALPAPEIVEANPRRPAGPGADVETDWRGRCRLSTTGSSSTLTPVQAAEGARREPGCYDREFCYICRATS
jgi:hypothetical protein